MRYRFADEIVSLALDGAPRIEVTKRFDPGDDVFSGPQGPERVPVDAPRADGDDRRASALPASGRASTPASPEGAGMPIRGRGVRGRAASRGRGPLRGVVGGRRWDERRRGGDSGVRRDQTGGARADQ